jgi:hypothetical protein
MVECGVMKESMPLLLTESLDPVRREEAHQHIESCAECTAEWQAYNETWKAMGDLPELDVPPRVREKFLAQVMPPVRDNVIPLHRRRAPRWLAQAAAVVIVAGGAFYAGRSAAPVQLQETPARIESVEAAPWSLSESRVIPAAALSPTIEGRPDIQNVQFVGADPGDGKEIGVSFDVKSRWTVTGRPDDKSMIRLLTYVLESENSLSSSRSHAIDWVRQTYSRPGYANPEIARALTKVLRNESHEGVRIMAVETLKDLPVDSPSDDTRLALIAALKSDPNPAVRLKAIEALANMNKQGSTFDVATVDTLREKAAQDDENLYVRVKAAELLKDIRP